MNLFKTLAMVGLVLVSTSRLSYGAENKSKSNSTNNSTVEVKCQLLKTPSKVLKETGLEYLNAEPHPGLAGVFTKQQLDVVWKALKEKKGVTIEELAPIAVRSGTSGKIQKGYDFSYPVDYDASGKPTRMDSVFLGTKLEVKPEASDNSIEVSFNYETRQLKEVMQIYRVKEEDLLKKQTLSQLVSTFTNNTIFLPTWNTVKLESTSVMLYTDQSAFYSFEEYETNIESVKDRPKQMKLKDPSRRQFFIITAKITNSSSSKTP
jgi:hypothetical protein